MPILEWKKCNQHLPLWSVKHNAVSWLSRKKRSRYVNEIGAGQIRSSISCCVSENDATIMTPSEAPYPSGKGAVCKTAMQRFEPARRLQTALRVSRLLAIS